jgi:hypothetical protein
LKFQDPAEFQGSHWIALWAKNRSQVFYFDSYGEVPQGPVKEYLKENYDKITYNKHKFQSVYSNTCGQYVITFTYFMSLGFEFSHVLKMFRKLSNTDQFVYDFIKNIE